MQRHRADQQREAQAHARGHQHRQLRARRQVVVLPPFHLQRRAGLRHQPLHHAGREQLLEFLAQEPELRAAQRQRARLVVRHAGGDHLQADRMRAVRLAGIARRVVQVGEGERCIQRPAGQLLQAFVQPLGQCRRACIAAEAAAQAQQIASRHACHTKRGTGHTRTVRTQQRRQQRSRHPAPTTAPPAQAEQQRQRHQHFQRRDLEHGNGQAQQLVRQAGIAGQHHQQAIGRARATRRLEQAVDEAAPRQLCRHRRQPAIAGVAGKLLASLHAAITAGRRSRHRCRNGAGRSAADTLEPILAGQRQYRIGVHDAAGDAAFHDQIAVLVRHCLAPEHAVRRVGASMAQGLLRA